VRKFKLVVLMAIIFATALSLNLTAQAAEQTTVDMTAKIDGDRFWQVFYSTAYGDEDSVTLYKIKSVVVEIRSGATVIEAFTFTPTSEQSHRFLLTTALHNISVQYRANTFTERQFSFSFDYRQGATLFVANNPSNLVVKTPFLNYR
jgi:hypothetical protein